MNTLIAPAARSAPSPEILPDVLAQDCNLAIWERPPIAGLAALLDADPQPVRFEAPLIGLEGHVLQHLQSAGYPDTTLRDALITDIVRLAQYYGPILGLKAVQIRLDIVTSDSCRKFHADYVHARLITTYIGTGTQWIEGEDSAHVAQGHEPDRINTLSTGAVGLFKGKLASDHPAIHRSPPIAGTGERRLILVLDPPRAR